MTYRVLSLFAGIGGFDLGLERTGGFKTVAFCEIEPFPQSILRKHWPEVPLYNDVRELTASRLHADEVFPNVIVGGFPCQDISLAGRLAGIGEGTRSGLWSEVARLVGEVRPQYLIVENVANLLAGPPEQPGAWFGRVLGDLAECGYDAEWENLPAAAVGAPHRRERVWLIAYPQQGVRQSRRLPDQDHVRQLPPWEGASEVYSLFCRGRGGPVHDRHSLRDDDGFPTELDRIAALGNAVVPQIPELIGRAILAAGAQRMGEAA